jgi:hypothetical protein
MRFMMLMKATEDSEAGRRADPRLEEAVMKFTQEMTRAGVVLSVGGLAPSSRGTRVRLAGGKLTLVDGPFAEAKELVGGYALIQARSKEEALEWGMRLMKLHQEILGDGVEFECEVREVFGPE